MSALRTMAARRAWLIGLLVLALAAAACADEEDGGRSADDPIRIAMVGPSASNDLAFTQSMVDSLNRLGETYNIEVDVTDGTFVIEDAAVAIRGYADDGFDIVLAHGSQFGGSLSEIAPDYPDTYFAWGTSRDTFGLPNVYSYSVKSDQGGYINGTMAAHLTESGVIGVVGPIEVGDIKAYIDGFVIGVASVDPSLTVNVNYIDSFSDVALAAEAAQAHIEAGADILTGVSQMTVGATGVAREHGVLWFGSQSDQTPLGEEIVVASQIYNWDFQLGQIVEDLLAGEMNGRVITADFSNGGLTMAYNSNFSLDADVRAAADAAEAGIRDGSISTGVE
ncbi:MAG: BMP family protein [Acidimicrobiia bacterium]|nr:BMP family protein [Acidimicrobiia bacterium]